VTEFLRVQLDVTPAGLPVHGQLSIAGEPVSPFEGYVALIAALEKLRDRHPHGPAELAGIESPP
jgi:hypothetical protein